jgi:hypothetical protein
MRYAALILMLLGLAAAQRGPMNGTMPMGGRRGRAAIDADGPDVMLNATDGISVVSIGRGARFVVRPHASSNASIQLHFGRIAEGDASGAPVEGHMVPSFALEPQSFSYGELDLVRTLLYRLLCHVAWPAHH